MAKKGQRKTSKNLPRGDRRRTDVGARGSGGAASWPVRARSVLTNGLENQPNIKKKFDWKD